MGQRGNFGGACGGWAHGTISPCSPVCYERGEREGAHTADGLHPQRYLLTLHIPWSSVPTHSCLSLCIIPHAYPTCTPHAFPRYPMCMLVPLCIHHASLLHLLCILFACPDHPSMYPQASRTRLLCILCASLRPAGLMHPHAPSLSILLHPPCTLTLSLCIFHVPS